MNNQSEINPINSEETTTPKRKLSKKNLLMTAFVIINVVALLYAIISDFSNSGSLTLMQVITIIGDNWYFLVYALLMSLGVTIFRAFTMFFMMRANTKRGRLWLCIKTAALGKYYDNITPLGTGGQPFQIYYMSKKNVPDGISISVPLTEFTVHRIIYILLSLAGLILHQINVFATSGIIGTTVVIMSIVGLIVNCFFPTLIVLFSLSRRMCSSIVRFSVKLLHKLKLNKHPDQLYDSIMTKLSKNSESMKMMFTKKRLLLLSVIFSICSNIALFSIAYFVLKAFGYQVDAEGLTEWAHVLVIIALIYCCITFIPTPGNSGAADLSFYLIFTTYLITGTASVAMITWRFFSYYLYIFTGLLIVVIGSFYDKKNKSTSLPLEIESYKD